MCVNRLMFISTTKLLLLQLAILVEDDNNLLWRMDLRASDMNDEDEWWAIDEHAWHIHVSILFCRVLT
jgi:hypothetical protein